MSRNAWLYSDRDIVLMSDRAIGVIKFAVGSAPASEIARIDSKGVSTIGTVTVGSAGKPKGIALYDEDTGAAFCVTIKSGALAATAGACK